MVIYLKVLQVYGFYFDEYIIFVVLVYSYVSVLVLISIRYLIYVNYKFSKKEYIRLIFNVLRGGL